MLIIALPSAPDPSPEIVTLGVISNRDVVSTVVENAEGILILLADPVTIYSLIVFA